MSKFSMAALAACLAVAVSFVLFGTSHEADALSDGVILGAYAQPIDGQSNQEAIQLLEGTLDAQLPMVRAYAKWDDGVGQDKPLHRWIRDGGRDLMLSVKPQREDGSIVTWRAVADAQPGSRVYGEMQDLARGIRNYDRPIIFGFHHEPEQGANTKFGTSEDFRAAFRKIHAVFEAEGVDTVHWAWIMTEWSFEVGDVNAQDRRRAELWYPGDDVVDMIASDTYNWDNCRGNTTDPWRSLEDDIAPLMRFAAQHPDKQLILAELGSDEGGDTRKADWIREAQALFKTDPYKDAFAALLYFHDDGREEGWPDCEWWLDSSDASRRASAAWFKDDFYTVRLDRPAPTPGNNNPFCNGQRATIVGTSGNDQLRGTAGADVIVGLGGNDTINGLAGDDVICGGPGDDTITGDGGKDRLYGEGGKDFMLGGLGPDVLVGGVGADRMNGQHGNDQVFGNEGNDVLRGGPHQDILRGGDHRDLIYGQGGWDNIGGGDGDDRLFGGVGADLIVGGVGGDYCEGNLGNDRVTCETGRP